MSLMVCFHIDIKYTATILGEQISCTWNNFPWIYISFTYLNRVHVFKACYDGMLLISNLLDRTWHPVYDDKKSPLYHDLWILWFLFLKDYQIYATFTCYMHYSCYPSNISSTNEETVIIYPILMVSKNFVGSQLISIKLKDYGSRTCQSLIWQF